jgi:formiminotetrahydrofolate cyclodeaminase
MAAAFGASRADLARAHGRLREIGARADALRGRALALGERELTSYEPVLAALRLPADDPSRSERLAAALSDASAAPLEVARAGVEVATLAQEVAGVGSTHLTGDVRAGLLLAEAACQAAAGLVAINLAARAPDDERLAEAADLSRRAAAARADVLGSP